MTDSGFRRLVDADVQAIVAAETQKQRAAELDRRLQRIRAARDLYWLSVAVREASDEFRGDNDALFEIDHAEYERHYALRPEDFAYAGEPGV